MTSQNQFEITRSNFADISCEAQGGSSSMMRRCTEYCICDGYICIFGARKPRIYVRVHIQSQVSVRYISRSVAEPFGINMSLSRVRWTDISRRVHKRGEAIIRFILWHGWRIQNTRAIRSLDHVRI